MRARKMFTGIILTTLGGAGIGYHISQNQQYKKNNSKPIEEQEVISIVNPLLINTLSASAILLGLYFINKSLVKN